MIIAPDCYGTVAPADWACLPQLPRSQEETAQFECAQQQVGLLFASTTATAVIVLSSIPPRPASLDGALSLSGLRPEADEATLRGAFSTYSHVVHVRFDRPAAAQKRSSSRLSLTFRSSITSKSAVVQLATHAQAVRAVESIQRMRQFGLVKREGWLFHGAKASLIYNERVPHMRCVTAPKPNDLGLYHTVMSTASLDCACVPHHLLSTTAAAGCCSRRGSVVWCWATPFASRRWEARQQRPTSALRSVGPSSCTWETMGWSPALERATHTSFPLS